MFAGVVEVVIASHDDVERAGIFDGGSDDDFFDSLLEIGIELGGGAEGASSLDNDIAARPIDGFDGIFEGDWDGLSSDGDGVFGMRDVSIPAAVDGIEL